MGEKLTSKQEKFCQSIASKEFDFIWEAWVAHYNAKNMSKNTIYQASCRLLADSKITARIKEIESEIISQSQATLNEILTSMSKRLRLDMRTFYNKNGHLLHPQDWTEEQAMCVNDFETKTISKEGKVLTTQITKIKLIEIKGLWDMFMKKFGAYITKFKFETEDLTYLDKLLNEIKK